MKFHIANYNHGGILLTLSGERDEDECTINRITAADSQIDIFDLFSSAAVCSMAEIADDQLREEARLEREDAKFEGWKLDRDFRLTA
jgi:hypothetical protein